VQDSSLVSVLDLDSIMPLVPSPNLTALEQFLDTRRTAGISMKLMCISLNDVIDVRLDGKANSLA
jgi:hypothetical protein